MLFHIKMSHYSVTLKEEHALRGNKKYTIIDAVKGGVRFKNSNLDSLTDEYTQTKNTYEKEQDKVVAEIVGIAGEYVIRLGAIRLIIVPIYILTSFPTRALHE